MPQTIHQRRMLAGRARRADQVTDFPQASLRREQRGKVIQWQRQAAEARHLREVVPAPGEDGSKPVVSRRVQNIILALVFIAACAIARSVGAL